VAPAKRTFRLIEHWQAQQQSARLSFKPLVTFLFQLRRDLMLLERSRNPRQLETLLSDAFSAASAGQLVDLGSIQQMHILACDMQEWKLANSVMLLSSKCGISPSKVMLLRQWQACIRQGCPEAATPFVQQLLTLERSIPMMQGDHFSFSLRAVQLQRLLGVWLHDLLRQLHGKPATMQGDSALLLAVDGFIHCSAHATGAILQCLRSADSAMAVHERLQAAAAVPPTLLTRDACLQAFTDEPCEQSSVGDGFSDLLEVEQDGLPQLLGGGQGGSARAAAAAEEQASALLQALQVAHLQDDEQSDDDDGGSGSEALSEVDSEELQAWRELHVCASTAAELCSQAQATRSQTQPDLDELMLPGNPMGRLMVQEVLRVNAACLDHWAACDKHASHLQQARSAVGAAARLYPSYQVSGIAVGADAAQSAVPLHPVLLRAGLHSQPTGQTAAANSNVRLAPLTRRSLVRSFLDQVKRVASAELDLVDAGMPHARRRSLQRSIARIAKLDSTLLEQVVLYMCFHAACLPPVPAAVPYGVWGGAQWAAQQTNGAVSPPLRLRHGNSWLTGAASRLTERALAAIAGFSASAVPCEPAAAVTGGASGQARPPSDQAPPPSSMWLRMKQQGVDTGSTAQASSLVKLDAQDVLSLLQAPPSHLPGRAAVDVLAAQLVDDSAVRQVVRALAAPGSPKAIQVYKASSTGGGDQSYAGRLLCDFTVQFAGSGAIEAPMQVCVQQELTAPVYDFHASRASAPDWVCLHAFWPAVCVPQSQITAAAARLLSKQAP